MGSGGASSASEIAITDGGKDEKSALQGVY
jgi:hypothetical protein